MNPSSLPRPHAHGGAGVISILQRRHSVIRVGAGRALSKRLAAGVDRGRWAARFNPRMAIDHCEGFDSAGNAVERFVPIDRIC
jgi:hypothetical protein